MKNKLILSAVSLLLLCVILAHRAYSQETKPPFGQREIIAILSQTPARGSSQGDLAAEIAQRGINFKVDDRTLEEFRKAGAKSFVLEAIRRAGEEAARPRLQTPAQSVPQTAVPVQPQIQATELSPEQRQAALARLPLLEQARWHALEYVEELPNFTVTQIVRRYERTPETRDWKLLDTLEIELTYHGKDGEKFKLLKVNGVPAKTTYEQIGGSTSTGEFGALLLGLFASESRAEFKELKTEAYQGRNAVLFDFRIKTVNSSSTLVDKNTGRSVVAGYQGTVWIDTESKRVLRIELSHEQIPASFPITMAENAVEYDWVTIADERYLLPVRAEVLLGRDSQRYYSRNVIELRNYHKFDSDLKILPIKDPPQ